MKRLTILIFAAYFCSCKSSHSQTKINPEAVKLNKMAFDTVNRGFRRQTALIYAITLLDKATAIDTNYFYAYQNKFLFQTELKQYSNALITSKHLLNLRPKNAEVTSTVAQAYDRAGDSLSAAKYYENALATYTKILDTMSVKNPSYAVFEMEKAVDLIMLNQPKDGYALLKKLYTDQTDPGYKQMYQKFMGMTRNDFLYPEAKPNTTYSDPIKK